ncbi:hypothetical protein [Ureibacillus thermosphaericus]|uniref:hypothetical protein n=1 Tax=Ureibacillus thermosphaericus TaxID=51173 RepID=UPI000BBCB8F5|nr:hypothetical protein [Ureibacillus thermosphaericus]
MSINSKNHLHLLKKNELSQPLNTRVFDLKQEIESVWSINILKGKLDGFTQYVVAIRSLDESTPSYYKYADIMSTNTKKAKQIELELMNRGGLGRNDFPKIIAYIERLRRECDYIEVGDVTELLSIDDNQRLTPFFKEEAESYFNHLLEYIYENRELFPIRKIETDDATNEGYVEGISQGVYIVDSRGIKKYGGPTVAIIPEYLRDVLDISSTKRLGAVFDYWIDKGYMYFDPSSVEKRKDKLVKLKKGMPPKRAYILKISLEEEF